MIGRRVQCDARSYYSHLIRAEVKWYDRHWNPDTSFTPPASELKWYHFNEPPIIDVTNYDDIMEPIEDGRLDRIIDEHTRYMKETDREIWPL